MDLLDISALVWGGISQGMTNLLRSKEDEALDDDSSEMAAILLTNHTLTFNRAALMLASYQSQDPRSCLRIRAPSSKTSSVTAFITCDFWLRDEAVIYRWRLVPTISRKRWLPSWKKFPLPLPHSTSLSDGHTMMIWFEFSSSHSRTVSFLFVWCIIFGKLFCVLWCCRNGGLRVQPEVVNRIRILMDLVGDLIFGLLLTMLKYRTVGDAGDVVVESIRKLWIEFIFFVVDTRYDILPFLVLN